MCLLIFAVSKMIYKLEYLDTGNIQSQLWLPKNALFVCFFSTQRWRRKEWLHIIGHYAGLLLHRQCVYGVNILLREKFFDARGPPIAWSDAMKWKWKWIKPHMLSWMHTMYCIWKNNLHFHKHEISFIKQICNTKYVRLQKNTL